MTPRQSELASALRACRSAFAWLALFSACINVLMLTAPLYMLQVFDRVLASRSTDTLLMLSFVAAFALLALAGLEGVRGFALVRISGWLDQRLAPSVLEASVLGALRGRAERTADGLRDLHTLRTFLGSSQMLPIMDVPWTPVFLAVVFLLNPLLGWVAVGGALVLLALACINEFATRTLLTTAGGARLHAMGQAEAATRNADAIHAMGMMKNLAERWRVHNGEAEALQASASARSSVISAVSKFCRLLLQVMMLGLGAWLVIANELTAGGMIAGSILLGRALAPVDQAIGSWKALVQARAARARLETLLSGYEAQLPGMPLPRPRGDVRCEAVSYGHRSDGKAILKNVTFDLAPGTALGLIGPTASGKTTLARLLVGNLRPGLGHVRLDGMDVSQWVSEDRGRYIGYLPQDIELFSGSIRENIARMGAGEADDVIAAAQLAGVHDMVLRLPQGYDTPIGEAGMWLSGGQRQRVALARALYGNPPLVVLDEPSASLDQPGSDALLGALSELKSRGTTLVLIAHQPSIVRQVDYLLVLGDGEVKMAGPRDEIISRVTGPAAREAAVSAVQPNA